MRFSLLFVCVLVFAGALLWMRQLGTPGQDRCFGVCSDLEDNAVVSVSSSGYLNGHVLKGGSDTIIVKVDAAGNRLWSTNELATDEEDLPATHTIDCPPLCSRCMLTRTIICMRAERRQDLCRAM